MAVKVNRTLNPEQHWGDGCEAPASDPSGRGKLVPAGSDPLSIIRDTIATFTRRVSESNMHQDWSHEG